MGRVTRGAVPGLAGVVGGLCWLVGPGVVGVVPWYLEVGPFVAPLFLVALVGVADRYYGTVADATEGTTGMWSLACGLGLVGLSGAVGLFELGTVAEAALVWLPATIGLVAMTVGSGLLGWGLSRATVLSQAGGAVVVLALPVALFVNPLTAANAGLVVGYYGIVWILLGWMVLKDGGPVPVLDPVAAAVHRYASVRGVVVGLAGGVLTTSGAATMWALTLGGTPRLGGDPIVIGGLHLATGVLAWLVLLVEPTQARDAVWSLGAFYLVLGLGQVVGLLSMLGVGSVEAAPYLLVVHLAVGGALFGAAADGAVLSRILARPTR